jgi:hypothetical protein
MDRKAVGERIKLYVGITGIPAASSEDVMREARTPTYLGHPTKDRVDRVARRSEWWWLRLLVGAGMLCLGVLAGLPIVMAVTIALLGGLLVISGLIEGFLHYRLFAKKQDSSH